MSILNAIKNAVGMDTSTTSVGKGEGAACTTKLTETHRTNRDSALVTTEVCANAQGVVTSAKVTQKTDKPELLPSADPISAFAKDYAKLLSNADNFKEILAANNPLRELAAKQGISLQFESGQQLAAKSIAPAGQLAASIIGARG